MPMVRLSPPPAFLWAYSGHMKLCYNMQIYFHSVQLFRVGISVCSLPSTSEPMPKPLVLWDMLRDPGSSVSIRQRLPLLDPQS